MQLSAAENAVMWMSLNKAKAYSPCLFENSNNHNKGNGNHINSYNN